MTTYNQGPYIESTLQSVFEQTYRRYELIVVDDGSTDDTPDRVAVFASRLEYIRQPNQGVAGARNTGVARAKGELLAFLDGDDLWEPEKLEAQVEAARRHPASGLVVTDGVQFDNGTILRDTLIGERLRLLLEGQPEGTGPCYRAFLLGNLIATMSQVMVPRGALEAVGRSDIRLPIASDWDLYLRISAHHDVTILNRQLVRWRYLSSSASGPQDLRPLRWGADAIAILQKHLALAPAGYHPLIRAELRRRVTDTAHAAFHVGRTVDRRMGQRYLLRLVLRNPLSLTAPLLLVVLCLPHALTRRVRRATRWLWLWLSPEQRG